MGINEKLNKLNEYYSRYCDYFISKNASIFLDYILELQIYCMKLIEEQRLTSKKIYISKENIILLVKEILKEIDPGCELLELFNTGIKNGNILIWTKEEKQNIIEKLGVDFDEMYDDMYCVFSKNNIVNCPLKEDISDVHSIIHEFMHYYSNIAYLSNKDDYQKTFSYFKELMTIYFEKYALDYLVIKGFDKEIIESIFNDRIFNATIDTFLVSMTMSFAEVQNREGLITLDNINQNEKFKIILSNFKILFSNSERLTTVSNILSIYNNSSQFSKEKLCDIALVLKKNGIGFQNINLCYELATYFAINLDKDYDTKEMILKIGRNYQKLHYSDEKILDALTKKYTKKYNYIKSQN